MINIIKMFAFLLAVLAFIFGWEYGVGATVLLTLFAVLFPAHNELTQAHDEPELYEPAETHKDSSQPHHKSD